MFIKPKCLLDNTAVLALRDQFCAQVLAAEESLSEQYPDYSFGTGDAGGWDCHAVQLTCYFSTKEDFATVDLKTIKEVALRLRFSTHRKTPRATIDVAWPNFQNCIEDSLSVVPEQSDIWPELTATLASQIVAELPRLIASFGKAVQRGNPPQV